MREFVDVRMGKFVDVRMEDLNYLEIKKDNITLN
jgi:hypothetical protein